MDNSISIYLGGRVWRADHPDMDYDLPEELGLLCIYCYNPVFLKKGEKRCPHFSHYSISDEKLDQCRLRQEAYASASYPSGDWRNLIEGVKQRLDFFQSHFLEIIIKKIEKYKEKLQEMKNSIDPLDRIISLASSLYCQNRNKLVQHSTDLCSPEKEDYPLQVKITCEAIDYLTATSSAPLLKELLTYSMYELSETDLDDLSYNANIYTVGKIGYKLAEIIALTDWVAHFILISQRLKQRGFKYSNFEPRSYSNFTRIDENSADIQPNQVLLEQIKDVSISKEFEKAVHFSQKMSRSEVFKNKHLDPSHPLQEYCLKFTSENKIMLHRLTSFGELKKQGTELCKFIEIREVVKSREWISVHPRYEYLLSSLGKDSSVTIHENPYYCQGLNMPIDLAYLNNDKTHQCLIAIGYPVKQSVLKIISSQSNSRQYEVLKNNIYKFVMKKYSYWLHNQWVKKMKEDLQSILVEEVLIRNFLVSRKDATQIAARLQELEFPIKEPYFVKMFSAIFYLPNDELQSFIKRHDGRCLPLRCSEERSQTT